MLGNYEEFKRSIYKLTNIDLSFYKERQMKRRIDALIDKKDIKSYNEYLTELKTNSVSYTEFLNHITINVSEFFRNPEQWNVLETEVLPILLRKSPLGLKIWSAACSTGDEPYSLVMLLSRFMPLSKIKIIATDIDSKVIEKAKVGLYNVKNLKGVPDDLFNKFFRKINETTYQIAKEIKDRVEFKKHNLLKDDYPANMDLIVCRNVLIYFTDDAKNLIYKKFNDSLKIDGFLFVGSTEQIIQASTFGYSNFRSFFYQKNKV